MRSVKFESEAWNDFQYWSTNNPKIIKKIISLINDLVRHPFSGIGKPEPLKNDLKGLWSRRINDEDRLVYRVESDVISIISLKGHYK